MTNQHELFDVDELPEVDPSSAVQPVLTILLHFAEPDDRRAFEVAIGRPIPHGDVIWYPSDPPARWVPWE